MSEDISKRISDDDAAELPQSPSSTFFPMDDEFTARDIEREALENAVHAVDTEEENTDSEEDVHQSSISELDDTIPESTDVIRSVAVDIPVEDDDEIISPISEGARKAEKSKAERPIDNRFDFLELFVFTMVAVLILTTFVFRHSIVDGGSMERTLYNGEHLIISDFFYEPKRGDIIVFQDYSKEKYSSQLTVPLVKRIIAVGGDTIRVYSDGRVYVNDMTTPINEDDYVYYLRMDKFLPDYYSENIPNFTYHKNQNGRGYEYIECTVPEGEVFVMGDHRDESTDSRYFGTVKESTILGKVLFRFYPFETASVID